MKQMKKTLSLILALVMLLSLGTTAFAGEMDVQSVVEQVEQPVVEAVVEEPVVEAVVEEPVVEEPVVEAVVEEPVVEEPVVEEPVVEEPVVEEPVVEAVVEEPVVENAIVAQPADVVAVGGEEVRFAVETTGAVSSFQWQYSRDGRRWSNLDVWRYGSSEELTLVASRSDNGCLFRVVVSFEDGTQLTSEAAKLTVKTIVIVSQPADVTVAVGEQADFAVEAKGAVASYQWQYSKDGKRWKNLDPWFYGAWSTLNVIAEKGDDGLLFRVVVYAFDRSKVVSEAAKLTIAVDEPEPEMPARMLAPVATDGPVSEVGVEVAAPEGALPADVDLNVDPVDAGQYEELTKALLGDDIEIGYALDISFMQEDGTEVEPVKNNPVIVYLTVPGLSEHDNVKIVHISDEGLATELEPVPEWELTRPLGENEIAIKSDEFSVYELVWTDKSGEQQVTETATIHWGYMSGDTFTEFTDTASLDSNAGSMSLNVIFDRYMYSAASYEKGEAVYALDSPILTKVTAADGSTTWTMQAHVTTGEGGAPETVTIEEGADIYVYYVEKSAGYVPPSPSPTEVKGPTTEKSVTNNHNGTYDIRLDITGHVDHTVNRVGANVIVIMDRTQSMSNNMPDGGTRMAAAKTALNTLITTLNPGTGENQNLINFTAVDFANSANYVNGINWTSTRSEMESYVSNLSYWERNHNPDGYGTCWQAGLYGGIVRARDAAGNENLNKNKTYIIFVTDGNANGWYTNANSDGGPTNNPRYQQQGAGTFVQAAYDAAIPNAVNASALCGNRIYGIFCGSTNDMVHLQDLMNYNGTQGSVNGTFINGTSASAIDEAFRNIAQTIVSDLGASNVGVDDGIPALANVSAAVSGSAGGFQYFITPKGGTETVWADAPSAGYSSSNGVTWDLSKAGVLADETVYSLVFTVWPTQEAYDLLANLNNGMPGYTLDQLDDATREQLVVTIGSTQYQYTPGADPDTGTWAPAGGSPAYTTTDFLSVIATATSVEYNVLTNTHLFTTYTYGENTYSDPPEQGLVSGAMLLEDQTIKIEKYWHNPMDAHAAQSVTLTVTKDDVAYMDVPMGEPQKYGDTEWVQRPQTEIHISCGVMTVSGSDVTVKSAGHDYTVIEPDDLAWYWDLTAYVYHPMVINGTNTMLMLVTKREQNEAGFPAAAKDLGDNQTVTVDGKTYYKFGGKLYVAEDETNILKADNDRRSNLQVKKTVSAAAGVTAPADALFDYKVNMYNPTAPYKGTEGYDADYDTFWFVVLKNPDAEPDNHPTADDIAWEDDGLVVDGATAEVKNGAATGYYSFDNVEGGESVTISIKAGWRICFTSVSRYTLYTVEELGGEKMPEGFVFKSVETSATNNKQGDTSTAAVVDEDNEMKVSGEFDKSNTDYRVAYTNDYLGVFYVYHSSDCTVERIGLAENGVALVSFDIFAKTKEGTFYGGYYKDYAGKSDGFDAAALTYTDNVGADDVGDDDDKAHPYTYQYIKDSSKGAWDYNKGYEESGTAMVPVSGTVYYLKEVPTGYLMPYTHYTYWKATKILGGLWTISATDDLCYKTMGFKVKKDDTPAVMVESLTITPQNNANNAVVLTAAKVFRSKGVLDGYLGYADITSYIGNETLIQQYWTTKDDITVFGLKQRTLKFNAGTQTTITGITKTDTDYTPAS